MTSSSYFKKKSEITLFAEKYCRENGLSVEKLSSQMFSLADGYAVFSQPTKGKAVDGLRNDSETMPEPTLIVRFSDNGYVVEETGATRTYLI